MNNMAYYGFVEACLPDDRHGLSNGNSFAILAAYIYTMSMNYER